MEIIDRITAANIEVPISKWHESYQWDHTISIICDRREVERIRAQAWEAIRDSSGNTTLFTNIGTASEPLFLPLANFIAGANNSIFIERVPGAAANDFRKKAFKWIQS